MERYYQTYIDHFKQPATNILEIGSRDGNHAEILRKLANISASEVFILEPHPSSFRQIIAKYPEFHTYELAISNKIGITAFNAIPPEIFDQGIVGTSSILATDEETIKKWWGAPHPINWIKVLAINGIMLLELIDRPGIDLVKIDVEGFTWEVLLSFGDHIRALKSMHIEVELIQIWKGQHVYREIQEMLAFYGFKEMYYHPLWLGGNQGDAVWVRID